MKEQAQATLGHVESHMAAWNTDGTHIDGYVAWNWDVRPETIKDLRIYQDGGNMEVSICLIADIVYSMEQDERLKGLDGLKDAARVYLDTHINELIPALELSINED